MAKKKVKSKAKQPPKSSIPENITSKVLAETYSTPSPPVFMKVCRLCESKDGPFLNIFDADKVTAKKIEELMPFGVRYSYLYTFYQTKECSMYTSVCYLLSWLFNASLTTVNNIQSAD